MNRRTTVNLVFFAAISLVMVGWMIRNIVSVERIDRPYAIAAEFPNAFGVLPKSEVTYLGVSYGEVSSVERITDGVRIGMKIKRGNRIPAGSTASILRKSALGEQYVDFRPPADYDGDGGPYLAAGTVLGRDRTTVPLEFSDLLRSASDLVASVPPDDVRTLIHEAAVGLAGRAESLRQLAEAGDTLSATLADRTEALDRLATNQTRLTRIVADHRGSLRQSLADLEQVADALAAVEGDLGKLLREGAPAIDALADLVGEHKAALDCDLKVVERLVDETSTPRRLDELVALLDIAPTAFARVWDVRDVEPDGVWVRVGFVAQPNNPPKQYDPPRALAGPRPPTVCGSVLRTRAAGVDYRPADTAAAPRSLPATGAGTGGGVALVLVAAAVAIRRARATTVRRS